MRIIKEARRNPELNKADRERTTIEVIKSYIGKNGSTDDYPKYFVSFRGPKGSTPELEGIEKMDFSNKNPSYSNTPMGLYAYPITDAWYEHALSVDGHVKDYMSESSAYYNIYEYDTAANKGLIVRGDTIEYKGLEDGRNLLRLEYRIGEGRIDISDSEVDSQYSDYDFKPGDITNNFKYTDSLKELRGKFLHKFYSRGLTGNRMPLALTKFYKLLGADYVLCLNSEFVHRNEPFQIVFLERRNLKLVEQNKNRNAPNDLAPREEIEARSKEAKKLRKEAIAYIHSAIKELPEGETVADKATEVSGNTVTFKEPIYIETLDNESPEDGSLIKMSVSGEEPFYHFFFESNPEHAVSARDLDSKSLHKIGMAVSVRLNSLTMSRNVRIALRKQEVSLAKMVFGGQKMYDFAADTGATEVTAHVDMSIYLQGGAKMHVVQLKINREGTLTLIDPNGKAIRFGETDTVQNPGNYYDMRKALMDIGNKPGEYIPEYNEYMKVMHPEQALQESILFDAFIRGRL